MNLHDSAIRLRQIASDILDVAETMSPDDGYISHVDTIRVTAVVVRGVLTALVANNQNGSTIADYHGAFVDVLGHVNEVWG